MAYSVSSNDESEMDSGGFVMEPSSMKKRKVGMSAQVQLESVRQHNY